MVNDPAAILNYYSNWLREEKKRPLNETKVLVVGQPEVGKTSLIRAIRGEGYDEHESKTDGIAIRSWHANGQVVDEPVMLNIWDFGGQEIMHATHQFFLTKRSLYLLVLDARRSQEENRVEYWLKIIQSFGGDSPVLIVGNKIDQNPVNIDRSGLRKKYKNLMGIVETSARTGKGIVDLQTAIESQVNQLPHVHDLILGRWFKVKDHLQRLGGQRSFITRDQYIELCEAEGISDEISQRTLISFLHDLGVVIHFQDEVRLATLGILNPLWVTNGVYKIINSFALFENGGELTREMLNTILDFPEYPPDKRLFIVDMMRKFELCFDIEPDYKFLVPDLLPKDEPYTGNWDGALEFQYHYNVLPSNILSRFIVRMHMYIYKTRWRSGVVLKMGNNTALVKADYEDRTIYISVCDDETGRRDVLSVIRSEFEAIHKSFTKIEVLEKVPVPGHQDADPVDYLILRDLERKQIEYCQVKAGSEVILVKVRDLLNGVEREVVPPLNFSHSEPTSPIKAQELEEKVPLEDTVPEIQTAAAETLTAQPKVSLPSDQSNALSTPLKKRWLPQVVKAIFVLLPRIFGQLILDLLGRKAENETKLLVGYVLIVLLILVALGVVRMEILVNGFKDVWRFFFPVK